MPRPRAEACVFILFLLFFLVFQNADDGFDSYVLVLDARDGIAFFHAHHLFYNSLVHILYRLSIYLGLEPMRTISAVNSIMGAAVLTCVYSIIRHKTSSAAALLTTIALGCLHAFWYLATTVEVNISSMMFLSASLFLLLIKPPSAGNSVMVFSLLALGTLFHQLAALAIVPAFIYEAHRHGSVFRALKYSLPSLISAVFIYAAIGFSQTGKFSIGELYKWATMYAHFGTWGTVDRGSLLNSLWGIVKAVFGGDTIRRVVFGSEASLSHAVYLGAVIISAAGLSALTGYSFRRLFKEKGGYERLLASLAAVYSIFACWWTPTDATFWIYPIMMIFPLMAVSAGGGGILRKILHISIPLLAAANIIYEIIPASSTEKSIPRQGAAALNKLSLTSEDLLLTNLNWIGLALNYYYDNDVTTTALAFRRPEPKEEVLADYISMIEKNRGRVIIFENEIKPEPHRRFLYKVFPPQDYVRVYGRYLDDLNVLDSIEVYGKQVRIFEILKDTSGQ